MASIELPLPKIFSVCTRPETSLINGSEKESRLQTFDGGSSSNRDSTKANHITRTKSCESIPVAMLGGCMDDVGMSCDS